MSSSREKKQLEILKRKKEKFKFALEKIGCPEYFILDELRFSMEEDEYDGFAWQNVKCLSERILGELGYRLMPNPNSKQAFWFINGARSHVYHKDGTLPLRQGQVKKYLKR